MTLNGKKVFTFRFENIFAKINFLENCSENIGFYKKQEYKNKVYEKKSV